MTLRTLGRKGGVAGGSNGARSYQIEADLGADLHAHATHNATGLYLEKQLGGEGGGGLVWCAREGDVVINAFLHYHSTPVVRLYSVTDCIPMRSTSDRFLGAFLQTMMLSYRAGIIGLNHAKTHGMDTLSVLGNTPGRNNGTC